MKLSGITQNQFDFMSFVDCISPPSGKADSDLIEEFQRCCSILAVSDEFFDDNQRGMSTETIFIGTSRVRNTISMTDHERSLALRNRVLSKITDIRQSVEPLKNRGVFLSDDPFLDIENFVEERRNGISDQPSSGRADQTISQISELVIVSQAETSAVPQISSLSFSVDNLKTTNSRQLTTEMLVPSNLMYRDVTVRDTLGSLDFKKRIPKMIATLDYVVDRVSRGTIIIWKNMADATGYLLTRHDVFRNKDKEIFLGKEQLKTDSEKLRDYVMLWALKFYTNLPFDSCCVYLDEDVSRDTIYTYVVKGSRAHLPSNSSLFSIETTRTVLSPLILASIETDLKQTSSLFSNGFVDMISPYPAISRMLFNDESFDWLIAAVNVKDLIEKKAPSEKIRDFSYIGGKFSAVSEQIRAGNFIIPKNPAKIAENVRQFVSSFGISQTLIEIFEKTGIIYYLDGDGTSPVPSSRNDMVVKILSSIDPENATVNIKDLLLNLYVAVSRSSSAASSTRAAELEITNPDSEDIQQFFSKIADLSSDTIDLSTFEGINRFVRVLRSYFDRSPKNIVPRITK